MTYATDTGNYWIGTFEGILILPLPFLQCTDHIYNISSFAPGINSYNGAYIEVA